MPDSTTLTELTDLALAFRAERDWQQFHNPKDVALSMSLEVAELKAEQIHSCGPDPDRRAQDALPLGVSLEPVCG